MTRRLVLSYLSITAFVLMVLAIPLGITFSRQERQRLSSDVEHDASALGMLVEEGLEQLEPVDYQAVADDYADRTGARVVIVDAHGISVGDSSTFDVGRDFSTRPEIATALAGHRSTGTRRSETVGTELLYVAMPVASGGEVFGAVRITFPTADVDARINRNWWALAALSGVVLAAVTLVGFALARSVTRPLRRLEVASEAMAGGELSARTPADQGPPAVRHLAETFNGMAARLEGLVTSQREFVANASHQLRTPLTALRLRLENVEYGADEATRHDLDAALDEVQRLAHLVDQLLLLARTEGGQLPTETVDLAEVGRSRAQAWGALAQEQDVEVVAEGPGAVPARAIAGSVEQILDNYLDNALAVAPPGSRVVVRAGVVDGWAELHVIDDGPGMSEDDRRHAFDRFWRADAGARRGTGLGLAIVRELAAAAGGEAGLAASPSGGMDAFVRLVAGS